MPTQVPTSPLPATLATGSTDTHAPSQLSLMPNKNTVYPSLWLSAGAKLVTFVDLLFISGALFAKFDSVYGM